jgi:hypothetical protein
VLLVTWHQSPANSHPAPETHCQRQVTRNLEPITGYQRPVAYHLLLDTWHHRPATETRHQRPVAGTLTRCASGRPPVARSRVPDRLRVKGSAGAARDQPARALRESLRRSTLIVASDQRTHRPRHCGVPAARRRAAGRNCLTSGISKCARSTERGVWPRFDPPVTRLRRWRS